MIDTAAPRPSSTETPNTSRPAVKTAVTPSTDCSDAIWVDVWTATRVSSEVSTVMSPSEKRTRVVVAPNDPRTTATMLSPGSRLSPEAIWPSLLVTVQSWLVLVTANKMPSPVPAPAKGSGNGASRTKSGVRSRVPFPPVHGAGSAPGVGDS